MYAASVRITTVELKWVARDGPGTRSCLISNVPSGLMTVVAMLITVALVNSG
jgi:hypothetical protein